MENKKKLCPFNGMKPCNPDCALYDQPYRDDGMCSLCSESHVGDIDLELWDDDCLKKLADKIAEALEPMLEAICTAIEDGRE